MKRVDTELMILGNGDHVKDASIVYDDAKIVYAGESEHAPDAQDTRQAPVVMPGMWDVHTHLIGMQTLDFVQGFTEHHALHAIRGSYDATKALMAGFTSVRELGGYGIYVKAAITEGTAKGPRIYSSGAALSMTGGHGDIHSMPLDVMEHVMNTQDEQWFLHVDGVADCLRGVRRQLRKGAESIKIMVSGGVLSEIDHPIHQQFNYDEVKAMVEEAHRAEVGVGAHCHGAPGMKNALDAGVDSIEHGTYLTEELADQMIEQGTVLVPTRLIIDESMGLLDLIPEASKQKMIDTSDRHWEAMQIAIKKGVTIACGTDIVGSNNLKIAQWGSHAKELEYYVKAGMSEMDAIVTATANGPKVLGGRAPKSGILKEGYDADILLLQTNPLDDITVLQNSVNFIDIIRAGVSYK